ncbi:MAG: alternative ribosome rescue aminoacyl-tRNA hydrolase ArfB [Planctomycetota bacterium]|nr:alternative ribosome rescue aminoacyl-tRNA hydrolase ArfB [Planctomycetota bacterium]
MQNPGGPTSPQPNGVRLTPRITLPEDLVEFTYASSSGPGGQNVNKRATKCTLRVRVTDVPFSPPQTLRLRSLAGSFLTSADELVISSVEHRSQAQNREACIAKLAQLVLEASVLPKVRRKTKPSRGSIERRLTAKRVTSERKKTRRGDE